MKLLEINSDHRAPLGSQEKNRIDQRLTILDLQRRIIVLEKQLKDYNKIQKLKVTTKDAVYFINYSDILYLKSESNYTYIHLANNKKMLISKTLKYLSEKIIGSTFMRIHASVLVNTRYLSQYIKGENKVILENNIALPVSKPNKKIVLQWMER